MKWVHYSEDVLVLCWMQCRPRALTRRISVRVLGLRSLLATSKSSFLELYSFFPPLIPQRCPGACKKWGTTSIKTSPSLFLFFPHFCSVRQFVVIHSDVAPAWRHSLLELLAGKKERESTI